MTRALRLHSGHGPVLWPGSSVIICLEELPLQSLRKTPLQPCLKLSNLPVTDAIFPCVLVLLGPILQFQLLISKLATQLEYWSQSPPKSTHIYKRPFR